MQVPCVTRDGKDSHGDTALISVPGLRLEGCRRLEEQEEESGSSASLAGRGGEGPRNLGPRVGWNSACRLLLGTFESPVEAL